MKGGFLHGEEKVLSQLPNVTSVRFVQEILVNPNNIMRAGKEDKLIDLVTNMTKLKHPSDKGILARKGIEY